jgi:hypothetical protein
MIRLISLLSILTVFVSGCISKPSRESKTTLGRNDTITKNALDTLKYLENKASSLDYNSLGHLISTINFALRTDDTKNYPDGMIPFIRIDSPQLDISHLIDKDEIIIRDTRIMIIIDYPVTSIYKFELTSEEGFSRGQLIKEISKHYYALYDEEERTANIKTLPMDQRTMYNRNRTNGKYGIWGHDIGDLVLTDISVYKNFRGEITLVLGIDS